MRQTFPAADLPCSQSFIHQLRRFGIRLRLFDLVFSARWSCGGAQIRGIAVRPQPRDFRRRRCHGQKLVHLLGLNHRKIRSGRRRHLRHQVLTPQNAVDIHRPRAGRRTAPQRDQLTFHNEEAPELRSRRRTTSAPSSGRIKPDIEERAGGGSRHEGIFPALGAWVPHSCR